MGILANAGAAVGQAFAPPSTAAGTAAESLGYGTLATGMNVGSALLSGVGGYQQAQFQAKLAGRNAENAQLSGDYAEEASKMRTGALAAEQTTSAAARGVSVDSGSVQRTVQSTREIGALDAAMIHYNAMKEAGMLESQSDVDKAAGRGAIVGGLLKAGTSFLSGANSLSDKYLTYQRSGAMAGA
jgi:hypothetical protein